VFEARSSTPVNPLSPKIPKIQLHSIIKSQTLSNQLAVPVQQPYGVPIQQPYGIPAQQPYGVPVQQPYGVPVQQPYGIPVQQPYGIPVQQPYGIPVQQPYGIPAQQPYGVPVQQPYGVPQHYSHVWQSKPLTERDLNVPTGPNTNVTGSMLWKKGLSNLDQLHDFYSKIFNGLAWHPDSNPSKSHLLRASAQFDIYIHRVFQGSFNLTLTHNTLTNTRSYEQGNSMTSISWGDAKSIIANPAYLNLYMHLYKSVNLSDPFILTIEN
jgi:hypothetical protein